MHKLFDVEEIQKNLEYVFKDPLLLKQALTHRRASQNKLGYERLEFLGDRILGMLVAEMLLEAFPEADEGFIAPRYAALVNTSSLAEAASILNLGEALILGQGQTQDVRKRDSVLADVFESTLAALYLDGGLEVARHFIENTLKPKMSQTLETPRDYKTQLQELLQKQGFALPVYHLVERTGPDHQPLFIISVESPAFEAIRGEGPTKKIAEQMAAQKILQTLKFEKK
jgi:ribonuclease III